MSRYISSLFIVGLILPLSANAQQWNSEQQEVIDHLTECWDFWSDNVDSEGGYAQWINECSIPSNTYWWSPDGAPLNNDFTRRNWGVDSEKDLGWVDIRPVSITVDDDIAVLHFYGYWREKTEDGNTVHEAKRTEVFRRIDGRWKMIAGHSTPISSDDDD